MPPKSQWNLFFNSIPQKTNLFSDKKPQQKQSRFNKKTMIFTILLLTLLCQLDFGTSVNPNQQRLRVEGAGSRLKGAYYCGELYYSFALKD